MDNIHELLSLEDCRKVIQAKLGRNGIKVLSHKIQSFSDKVEGLMGQHYRVEIEYKDEKVNSEQFFMKILNGTMKTIFDLCISVNAYEKEEFIYTTYLDELKKFNIDLDCLPRCYLCKPYLTVLEDLSVKGFLAAGGVDLDLDTCKTALETVAKFHCSSILYEFYKSKDQGSPFSLVDTYPSVFRNVLICKDNNLGRQWFLKSVEGVCELIRIIPENDIKKDVFEKELREYVSRLYEINEGFNDSLCTILHGDLWSNNFLFKYHEGKPCESILLDFQLIKYGPPSLDVLHFIYNNTRKCFRDLNIQHLIDYYYDCVRRRLNEHNFNDIPTKTKLLLFTKDLKVLVKLLCLCDRTVTLMASDTPSSTYDNDENLRRYLFEERTGFLVNSFKADEDFREIIQEDLLELRELLFNEHDV
ncbi:hypothetical protein RI129_004956 [Pyrocoelia pectoralis]|uniref:CHK kinase-like domain-containing protein n=1 Tax=Pyrocoelia pectoralis TaxID=417401 RepID=A0AAN7ZL19_9COLE